MASKDDKLKIPMNITPNSYSRIRLSILIASLFALLFFGVGIVGKLPPSALPASQASEAPAPSQTEILWDTWGVPHIFAKDDRSLFRAFGYAQMQSHGDLILRLYGQARGRGAEYWGDKYLEADRWTRLNNVYPRAKEWYQAQSPEFRGLLDAFAEGVNEYAREHKDKISDEVAVV